MLQTKAVEKLKTHFMF